MKSAALAVLAAAVGAHVAAGTIPTPSHANFYLANNLKASNFTNFAAFPPLTAITSATDDTVPGDKACDMTTLHNSDERVAIGVCHTELDEEMPFRSFKVVANTDKSKYGIEFWDRVENPTNNDHCPDKNQMTHAQLKTKAANVAAEHLSKLPVVVPALQHLQVPTMFANNGAPRDDSSYLDCPTDVASEDVGTAKGTAKQAAQDSCRATVDKYGLATSLAEQTLALLFSKWDSFTVSAGTHINGSFDAANGIAFGACHEIFNLKARRGGTALAEQAVMVKVYKETVAAKCSTLSPRDVTNFCRGKGLAGASVMCGGSSCLEVRDRNTCCNPVTTCGGSNGKASKCIFPFTYRHKGNDYTFNECTSMHHDQRWCYVANDPEPGMKRWGNCDSTACTTTSAASGVSMATTLLALGVAMRAMM